MVERVLLVINRSAGTSHGQSTLARLQAATRDGLDGHADLQVELVGNHLEVTACTSAFLAASHAPGAVIAGGGGGTLRAVIEAICEGSAPGQLPDRDRIRVAALRMGSGNVLARQFGVPRDPYAASKGILMNLRADRTAQCCIIRCEIGGGDNERNGAASPDTEVRFAATLGGFGQFGRVPSDLARWHRRHPALHRIAARALGIERLTDVEYALALFFRAVLCAIRPGVAETVRISSASEAESMRLLAGVLMNFPLEALPFDPGVHVRDEALSLSLIPLRQRLTGLLLFLGPRRQVKHARHIRIGASDSLTIRLMDRDSVDFFLDEDPTKLRSQVSIQVAGTLAFVPGPGYRWSEQPETTA